MGARPNQGYCGIRLDGTRACARAAACLAVGVGPAGARSDARSGSTPRSCFSSSAGRFARTACASFVQASAGRGVPQAALSRRARGLARGAGAGAEGALERQRIPSAGRSGALVLRPTSAPFQVEVVDTALGGVAGAGIQQLLAAARACPGSTEVV